MKNFPAGYVGSFYRSLADNVDNFVGSDFYSWITKDSDLPEDDVQKCILAMSDVTKSIQTDINHYLTRDRINDASLRQKLHPISKNTLRRQNPLELVFEDVSTCDAENPIVGSLLREIDLNKKQTDSDFIKSLPSQPGKEFEIKKRLDKLRDIKRLNRNDRNNNNNPGDGGGDLFPSPLPDSRNRNDFGFIPDAPTIRDFIDSYPEEYDIRQRLNQTNSAPDLSLQQGFYNLRGISNPSSPPFFANNSPNFHVPAQTSSLNRNFSSNNNNQPPVNNLFGSQTATLTREKVKEKNDTQVAIDDAQYELPENPDLELGDGLVENVGTTAEDIFQVDNITKEEEENVVLEKLKD